VARDTKQVPIKAAAAVSATPSHPTGKSARTAATRNGDACQPIIPASAALMVRSAIQPIPAVAASIPTAVIASDATTRFAYVRFDDSSTSSLFLLVSPPLVVIATFVAAGVAASSAD
jgi:hypothetical protein